MTRSATLSTAMQSSGFSENINVTKYADVADQTLSLVLDTSLKTQCYYCHAMYTPE